MHDKKQNMSFNEVTALWVPERKVFTGERLQEQEIGRGQECEKKWTGHDLAVVLI